MIHETAAQKGEGALQFGIVPAVSAVDGIADLFEQIIVRP